MRVCARTHTTLCRLSVCLCLSVGDSLCLSVSLSVVICRAFSFFPPCNHIINIKKNLEAYEVRKKRTNTLSFTSPEKDFFKFFKFFKNDTRPGELDGEGWGSDDDWAYRGYDICLSPLPVPSSLEVGRETEC